MRKAEKTIKIKEEFQIPGTNVVIEAGDSISLVESMGSLFPPKIDLALERWTDEAPDPFASGMNLGSAIVNWVENSNPEFQEGFFTRIKSYMR